MLYNEFIKLQGELFMDELKCPICGEPTYLVYGKNPRKDRLCAEHGTMANKGLIEQCPDCGKWHKTDEICECKQTKQSEPEKQDKKLTCLICGQPSKGKHFCYKCWTEYKDKSIDIRIKNCCEVEILDKYGNQQYKCDDGRKVRSKSEKIISDFLFKYGIRTIYEKTVYYYKDDETIELHPDFYLPDYDMYIEHNGLNTKSYKHNKSKTQKMYEELGYKVIITTEEDLADIDAKLKPILKIN